MKGSQSLPNLAFKCDLQEEEEENCPCCCQKGQRWPLVSVCQVFRPNETIVKVATPQCGLVNQFLAMTTSDLGGCEAAIAIRNADIVLGK